MLAWSILKFILNHPLNKNDRIGALKRFIAWQVGSRLVPGPVLVPFVNDAVLLVSPGMTGATGNIYTGLHEFEDMAFILHFLRCGDLFVDVGANVGSYTILASAAVGARSISFEPIPGTYKHLLRNVRINDVNDRVAAHNVGIGKVEGVLKFTSAHDTTNHVANAEEDCSGGTVDVQVRTLDGFRGPQRPSLIKIDVEGFETNVILGAEATLSDQSLQAVIMELNGSGAKYGFDEGKTHKMICKYGFGPFTYDPIDRRLIPLEGMNRESGNTIYVRSPEFVQGRLSSAPHFSVQGQRI